jgi:hypothetical protein
VKRFVLFSLLCVPFVYAAGQTNPADITAAELREHVTYLASDELAGRGSGSDGNREAAIYIAGKLKLQASTALSFSRSNSCRP